jgi:Acetoacetate decarboxylase (ADC)
MARPALAAPERHAPRAEGRASGKPASFDYVGRMTAVVAVLPLSQDAARAMLPTGLELAAQDLMPGERHPLVLMLGQQTDVRPRLLPLGADYLEAILVVPFVELRDRGTARGPFCYCPRLLLDRRLPIIGGRLLYRYDKRRALIRMTADSYRIEDPARGELLLTAHFRAAEAPVEPSRSCAAMLFDLPVISRAAHGWRYSLVDFGLDRALIEPLELKLTIHRPFVSGLPAGEFAIAGTEGDTARAFRIQTSWRLSGPWARNSHLRTWLSIADLRR